MPPVYLPLRQAWRDRAPSRALAAAAIHVALTLLLGVAAAEAARGDCGQPATDGANPTATDALVILRVAVGLDECEICICDANDSGDTTATDALLVLRKAVSAPVELVCSSCGGGPVDITRLDTDELEVVAVTAAAGAQIQLAGATLTIPPGALPEDAEIALVSVPVDSIDIPSGDGAWGGQVPIGHHAFMLFADRDLELMAPLVLRLPYDPALLDPAWETDDFHVAAIVGSYLVPQGPPTSVDTANAELVVTIEGGTLEANFEGQAMAAGGNFAAICSRLGAWSVGGVLRATALGLSVGLQWQTLLAVVDDVKQVSFTFSTLEWDDHFKIRYRSPAVLADAIQLGLALEAAHDLFVDDMGMDLPNFFNLDGLYTVYLDNFDNHAYVGSGERPDGFTLPGSSLIEGASYVGTHQPKVEWPTTAVHEYFHALQFGSLRSPFTINNLEKAFNPSSVFLFEGSTTALSGRLSFGAGTTPARMTYLEREMPQLTSIFKLEDGDPQDTAQDFFVFLEKGFGSDLTFYPEIFENLGSGALSVLDNQERAVAAIDTVLRDRSGGSDDMFKAWSDFLEDRLVTSPDDYNATQGLLKPDEIDTLATDGSFTEIERTLPPLSYWIYRIQVPPLAGPDDNRVDVEVAVSAGGTSGDLAKVWLIGEGFGDALPMAVDIPADTRRAVVRLLGVRGATSKPLFLGVGNPLPYNEPEDDIPLSVESRVFRNELVPPEGEEAEWEVCVDLVIDRQFLGIETIEDYCITGDGLGGTNGSAIAVNLDRNYENITQRGQWTGNISGDTIVSTVIEQDRDLVEPVMSFDTARVELSGIPLHDTFLGNEFDPFDELIFQIEGTGVCNAIDDLDYTSAAGFFEAIGYECSPFSSIYLSVKRPHVE